MTGKCMSIPHPVVGSAGCISARSSVFDLRHGLFTRVTAALQEIPTSGFYSVRRDTFSTRSGLCLKPKASPTVARLASRICAESSLRAARLSSGDTAQIAKKASSRSPWLAPVTGRLFFD
jgi:hypothetical protein